MRKIKSERLKKLETELNDLEQWLKLGLVPKRDIPRHKEEIASLREKVNEELARLRFLKESGDLEEYTTPKRASGRTGYTELGTLPDIEIAETGGFTESGFSGRGESTESEETTQGEEREGEETRSAQTQDEPEDDPFSDRNRWRRIRDPESDEW